jgi:hypothetical protein
MCSIKETQFTDKIAKKIYEKINNLRTFPIIIMRLTKLPHKVHNIILIYNV